MRAPTRPVQWWKKGVIACKRLPLRGRIARDPNSPLYRFAFPPYAALGVGWDANYQMALPLASFRFAFQALATSLVTDSGNGT
jgi:hypothetical protein